MPSPSKRSLDVDFGKVAARLPTAYAHIGVYDVRTRKAHAAKDARDVRAIDLHHASLFANAVKDLVVKDRFVCFWFYPPHTREGTVQGYPIDWAEANLLVRLDPRWSYVRQALLPAHATPQVDANITQQLGYAAHILGLYRAAGLQVPLSVHMIGPRATDSLFYAHRWEPPY